MPAQEDLGARIRQSCQAEPRICGSGDHRTYEGAVMVYTVLVMKTASDIAFANGRVRLISKRDRVHKRLEVDHVELAWDYVLTDSVIRKKLEGCQSW